MSNLACSSSFSCLGSCQSCPTNSHLGCSHSKDVTIQCSKFYINMLLKLINSYNKSNQNYSNILSKNIMNASYISSWFS